MQPKRTLLLLALLVATALTATLAPATLEAQSPVHRSALHDYRLTVVADGFEHPWAVDFLPDGSMLVTEQPGRLRIVRDGMLVAEPVSGLPEVRYAGQGGLLDVAVHPDFPSNGLIYLSYSKPNAAGDQGTTAVIRGRLEGDRLTQVEEIFEAEMWSQGRGHYGSRIVFDGQGHVFISLGDRQAPPRGDLSAHPAQDLTNHYGTIVRLNEDGSVPSDNPFVGREGALPQIWSYGHRNVQGMTIHPMTGELWANEHGPQGGDELNRVEAGNNYGWPVIGYGVNYRSGSAIHEGTMREGMEHPEHIWVPSIGISGLLVYTGSAFPSWQGDFFNGGLSGQQLARLDVQDGEIVLEETLVNGMGRIRDVVQGPDGMIYLAIDGDDGELTPILRMQPAGAR